MSKIRDDDKEQRAIQLTLSNAVDQTRKIRVEVPAGTTVEEAARESGVFPAGAFDVFTAGGESVTHASVDEHRDEVLYVGPQKVAGGAMEPSHVKSIMFTSAFDPEVRHEVVPGTDQTVHQAAEMAGLGPRDGSEWQVYTAIGEDVGGQPAAELAGQVLYVGPKAIDAGAILWNEIGKARSDFATLQAVEGHRNGNEVGLLHVILPDQRGRTIEGEYRCVVDARSKIPMTHVLNLRSGIRHPYVYTGSKVPGTKRKSQIVCHGDAGKALVLTMKSPSSRLSAYLNHISSILNS